MGKYNRNGMFYYGNDGTAALQKQKRQPLRMPSLEVRAFRIFLNTIGIRSDSLENTQIEKILRQNIPVGPLDIIPNLRDNLEKSGIIENEVNIIIDEYLNVIRETKAQRMGIGDRLKLLIRNIQGLRPETMDTLQKMFDERLSNEEYKRILDETEKYRKCRMLLEQAQVGKELENAGRSNKYL